MHRYPDGLLDWSGDKAGGVKKLFYTGSGRPAGGVIKTGLLTRLEEWAEAIAAGLAEVPKFILLIGGPGNGKTEAVEYTIQRLDSAMQLDGALVQELAERFSGKDGQPTRLVKTEKTKLSVQASVSTIAIVQDGSEAERGASATPAQHLCDDIRKLMEDGKDIAYLACVNRGVLDDALIFATERNDPEISGLLKQVIQAVSLSAKGITSWPLESYPAFAVWPMDVESLVEELADAPSAARQIIESATSNEDWPEHGSCEAGERCPFCTSRKLLGSEPNRSAFIRILRWYELASGKRWNFRDLFSLTAFLLAGTSDAQGLTAYKPCEWAASMVLPKGKDPKKTEMLRARGLFRLVAAQYQHALFGAWPAERAATLKSDLKELKLSDHPVLAALQQFLALDKRKESTSTLRTQLAGIASFLDPAFANPSLEVVISANTRMTFGQLDRRFSLSIKEGREFLQKRRCLSTLETDLLKALEEADSQLSEEGVRRHKPATAERVQALLRLIACRIGRRSIGVRSGVTRDSDTLDEFSRILSGNTAALQIATQQVQMLLNRDRRFLVSLNTTFGEPLPPPERRALLTTDVQRVSAMPLVHDERRPKPPVRFLSVGSAGRAQPVALTYELFKSTKSLRKGMVPASLPRSVVALLDTTRAKLAGSIVRDEDALDGSEIRLGLRDDVIVRSFGAFSILKGPR